jgi:Macrocin-O-methyltransferase (TylF)
LNRHDWSERRNQDPKRLPKIALARLGTVCSGRVVYELNGAFNYLHVGWWLSAHGFSSGFRARSRMDLFEIVAAEIGEREVLYLEFGVHRGDSMRVWAKLLRNPRSHLHGFDSFLGLPHDWSLEGHARGYFTTGGEVPEIDDPRVRFFPGWFEDTLPSYEWPKYEVLVVMLDADLYSSTATVLRFAAERLVPGSYLYFDQFHHRADELRAFAEYYDEHDVHFRLVGTTRDLSGVLFQRTQ